ncbi:kelch motif family protein [Zea mays]|uniref:F-box/kelch-repeat protein OR23 n=1 Tax=Zea mays TaxID=4577 RepID=B4FWX6_MAIZE|nr:kelch motif family protein [Zea mays]ACF86619.1 unknown [Zea mays]
MASSSSDSGRIAGTLALRTSSALAAASLIPGLPDDVAAVILCLLTFPDQSRLRATSRAWCLLLSAATLLPLRRSLRLPRRHLLCLFPTDPSLASPILLDPAAPTTWWPLPPLPCSPQLYGLANFTALAVGRHLYVLGGSCFDARSYPLGQPSASAAVYRLDLANSRHCWERLPDMQLPRGSFACAHAPSAGGLLVAGGGSRHPMFPSNGSRTGSTEWYDATTHSWHLGASMPRDRAGCVGFLARGAGDGGEDEFWVMGGYDGYTTLGGVVPNDVYCRDAVALGLWSGKWRVIGDMWEEGERRRLGPIAALSADDGRITEVFMLDGNDVFRYDFASNRWLKEATTRRKIPNTESCGFVPMNGELYVLRSAKVRVESSGPWRQLKKKLAMEFQVYNPGAKKWRVLTTYPPVDAPIDFRTAALCTVEL